MNVASEDFDSRESHLVKAIEAEPGLTMPELSFATGMSLRTVSPVLAQLAILGQVVRVSEGWFPADVSQVLAAIPGVPGRTPSEIISNTGLGPKYVYYAIARLYNEGKIRGRRVMSKDTTRWFVPGPSDSAS